MISQERRAEVAAAKAKYMSNACSQFNISAEVFEDTRGTRTGKPTKARHGVMAWLHLGPTKCSKKEIAKVMCCAKSSVLYGLKTNAEQLKLGVLTGTQFMAIGGSKR